MHTFQDKDAKVAFLQKAIDTLCKCMVIKHYVYSYTTRSIDHLYGTSSSCRGIDLYDFIDISHRVAIGLGQDF